MTDFPDICLVGGAGVGKSTVADLLVRFNGYRRLGFAGAANDPHLGSPRDIVTRIWGDEAINDRLKLITMANAARSVDEDVWLQALARELIATQITQPVVVDDCRFLNEFWGLKERGFVTIRLEADSQTRENRLKANGKWLDGYFENPIEHYLDDEPVDFTVWNGRDVAPEDTYWGLQKILEKCVRRAA